MVLARVTGSVVATVKHTGLGSTKLLLVQPITTGMEAAGETQVAVDVVGAGEGEIVVVATGEPARRAANAEGPVDAAVVGIVDSLSSGGARTYAKP
jgi:ethanolamine utilization protein EutN